MKIYKIFKNPAGQYEAVKQGWSWPAFFFGGIWACVKKIWDLGITLIIWSIILQFTVRDLSVAHLLFMISLIIKIILGGYGNSLREKNLINRGYQYQEDAKVIFAQNPQAAVAQYISEYKK
ncbi:DUF2628 domain-containing protein [uncultured Neisseria sp.]|uniref:DUF2628 domain-containing protein n=1 Tax=uncultured Neisseria sp. TaxID=237778 RepID=UPI0025E75AC0|nr:DUF2628 domain-containing protein [uncultured Neisseria sp.]